MIERFLAMGQTMTIKTKQVLDSIISCNRCTIETLANELNMTQRQIRYHLNLINQYTNEETVSVDYKGGVYLTDKEMLEEYRKHLPVLYKFTKEERIKGIYILLAFRLSELNLTFLSKKMKVARTTIKNDLKEVQKKLKEFQLTLNYDKKYYISGDEKDIFTFHVYCISILFDFYDLIDAYDLQQFKEIDILSSKRKKEIQQLERLIIQYISKEYETLKGKRLIYLSHIILTMIYYYKNNIMFPFSKYQLPSEQTANFKKFIYTIEKKWDIRLDEEQMNQISSTISFLCMRADHHLYNSFKKKAVMFIYGLISYIEKTTGFVLHEDIELMNALFYHMMLTYTQGSSVSLSNDMEDKIRVSFTIKKLIEDYCLFSHEKIDENEMFFLQLHILNSFRKIKKLNKKKVLLVTSASNYVVQSLCHDLESIFYIDVIQQVTPYELSDNLDDYDAVLFTEEIPLSYRHLNHVVKINFVLTQEDFRQLSNLQFDIYQHSIDLKQLEDALSFLSDTDKQKTMHAIYYLLKQDHINMHYSSDILIDFKYVYVPYIDPDECQITIHEGLRAGFEIDGESENILEIARIKNVEYRRLKSKNAGLILRGLFEMK